MKTQPLLVVECTNWEIIYTTLLFEESIDLKDVKKTIYEIKNRFYENNFDDWTVEDLLNELSTIYDFVDCGKPNYVEV